MELRKGSGFLVRFLGLIVQVVQPIIVMLWLLQSPYTVSIHLSPSPSKFGRQSCLVACLLICVSGGILLDSRLLHSLTGQPLRFFTYRPEKSQEQQATKERIRFVDEIYIKPSEDKI